MPKMNGGLSTIPRTKVELYARRRLHEGKSLQSTNKPLISSVRALKEAIDIDTALRMSIVGGLADIPAGKILHGKSVD